MTPAPWWLLAAIGGVALLYASVGHGGGSSYIALFVLADWAPDAIRPAALMLNLLVAGIAAVQYYRAGHWYPSLLLPFIAGSVPSAWIGGSLTLNTHHYRLLLGLFLLVTAVRLWWNAKPLSDSPSTPHLVVALPVGVGLGLISGILGIGGGIILSPLIVLAGWGHPKMAAATAAAFIWVNSFAGLSAIAYKGGLPMILTPEIAYMLGIVVCCGWLGSRLGSSRASLTQLNRLLGLVTLVAAMKMLIG
jgi:uncharacterized membrane protein YfcA